SKNTIKGSSANDFLVGGSGDNTFESGGGHDIIIGGDATNTYIARSGPTKTDSVTFLGKNTSNTADYSNVNSSLNLTLSVSNDDPNVVQLTDNGSGGVDALLNVQTIKLSQNQDTLAIADNALGALRTIKEIDAGQTSGTKDILNLTAIERLGYRFKD